MNLKDYTTEVGAERTIMEIERILAQFGASKIMKDYLSDGTVNALAFQLNGKGYRLPANIQGVKKILYDGMKEVHAKDVMSKRDVRARNVAWRIIKDWIYAQMSLIASGQAQPDEVLLPYMWDGKRTVYELFKDGKLQLESKGGD